ncbi:MAG TPA: hypothetical protein VF519_01655 [Mycobacteriales bacterium]
MPNLYALAAHPLVQQVAQEEHKTKGGRAVFGVILMFMILCGGVWMLLQSSFGPWQAYLISGTAFWGSWLVLAVIWFFGVPGIGPVPRSTPRFNGPQGAEQSWVIVNPHGEDEHLSKSFEEFAKENPNGFFTIDESLQDPNAQSDKSAAESAANERISEEYARDLGVGAADVTVPNVITITETQLGKDDGEFKYARVTYGPATPNATDNEPTKALIARIQPKTVELALHSGSLAAPTYVALLIFSVLFALHVLLLVLHERRQVTQPEGAPERVAVPA